MDTIRWGIIGCGRVCEVKSGPALQKANGSALVAVTRRDRAKAEDFAARHGVRTVHADAESLIADPDVDAVYVATPPSSHLSLALGAAARGKPCLVEKPMALTHADCVQMVEAFRAARVPLWVAYYRRALPRFRLVRQLLADNTIGQLTSVQIRLNRPLADDDTVGDWRLDPQVAGAGLFFDLGSHAIDLIDFLAGPVTSAAGLAVNTARLYPPEDVTGGVFQCEDRAIAVGLWNFNAAARADHLLLIGTGGEISTAVFDDVDVVVTTGAGTTTHAVRNPPHVHQPLVQCIVDELRGDGVAESTGESAARTSWAMEQCVAAYYGRRAR
ncbi:MAG: Gfo/Idh/MocA family oxidoreductase [Acidobacteria bacterium]|nr:Gfo/Idh/MocA family oxidoreductase [Acidobacteriota bacterium]